MSFSQHLEDPSALVQIGGFDFDDFVTVRSLRAGFGLCNSCHTSGSRLGSQKKQAMQPSFAGGASVFILVISSP